jgi:hypothetical protein
MCFFSKRYTKPSSTVAVRGGPDFKSMSGEYDSSSFLAIALGPNAFLLSYCVIIIIIIIII